MSRDQLIGRGRRVLGRLALPIPDLAREAPAMVAIVWREGNGSNGS